MAKKIGILFGMEDTFPWAFIERVNELGKGKIVGEPVSIDKLEQGKDYGYAVIIDRISQDVPFYRSYLRNAALNGTYVMNNPFWWSADEKFFNNALMTKLDVPVPKTVLLPSHDKPEGTEETSFRNLKYPLDWEYIFDYIGFPAYMKPHDGGGWRDVYRVDSPEDLWEKYAKTHNLVMLLQEEIIFDDYFRVYCLGRKNVHIMPYNPKNPHHLRYVAESNAKGKELNALLKQIKKLTLKLNKALGYDFNTAEFAVRDGVPYAIDFWNPAPDADRHSVGEDNFEWIVENAAKYAIEVAKKYKPDGPNIAWGEFVTSSITEKS